MESGGEHLGAVHLDWQSALMGLPQKLSSSLSELVNLSCCVDLCEVHFMTKEITLNAAMSKDRRFPALTSFEFI